jgi:hypothetical protein
LQILDFVLEQVQGTCDTMGMEIIRHIKNLRSNFMAGIDPTRKIGPASYDAAFIPGRFSGVSHENHKHTP